LQVSPGGDRSLAIFG